MSQCKSSNFHEGQKESLSGFQVFERITRCNEQILHGWVDLEVLGIPWIISEEHLGSFKVCLQLISIMFFKQLPMMSGFAFWIISISPICYGCMRHILANSASVFCLSTFKPKYFSPFTSAPASFTLIAGRWFVFLKLFVTIGVSRNGCPFELCQVEGFLLFMRSRIKSLNSLTSKFLLTPMSILCS